MAHLSSSRGFVMPIMVVGFIVVGLLATIGIINLFRTPNTSSKTASQTIQGEGSIQKIAENNIKNGQACDADSKCESGKCISSVCRSDWLGMGERCDNSGDCITGKCDNVCVVPNDPFKRAGNCDRGVPYVRLYDDVFLRAPIPRQNGTPLCVDLCDQQTLDRMNLAIKHPATSNEMRDKAENYMFNKPIYDSIDECNARNPSTSGPSADYCIFGDNFKVCANLPLSNINTTALESVNDSVSQVSVQFTNLPNLKVGEDGKKFTYFYCLKSVAGDCSEDDWETAKNVKNSSFTLSKVCGDGARALKTDCGTSDWFHAGKIYRVFLAQGKKASTVSPSDLFATASFYVSHFYPEVIDPKAGAAANLNMQSIDKSTNGTDLKVTLKGRSRKGGGGEGSDLYNDYWVQFIGIDNGYKSSNTGCVFIPQTGEGSTTIPLLKYAPDSNDNSSPLAAGEYILRIKDGKGGNSKQNNTVCHEGDFTLYDIPITINQDGAGVIGTPKKDPRNKESTINLSPPLPPPPICLDKDKKDGYCTAVPTALGFTIHTEPERFISDIFTIVLSIGGIATFVFFIQAGYKLMTSAGNKEKVASAREQITAAIMGLLFIILSITILEFIGINILRIPGFGR